MESKGVIYLVYNPKNPGFVKISYGTDIEHRISLIKRTDIKIFAVYESNSTDRELHDLIMLLNADCRENGEWFKLKPEEAYHILECIAKLSGTEDKLKKL